MATPANAGKTTFLFHFGTRKDWMKFRCIGFCLAVLGLIALYWAPLKSLAILTTRSEIYPYTVGMPLLSAGLIWLDRRRIFSHVRYGFGVGAALLVMAIVMRWGYNANLIGSSHSTRLAAVSFAIACVAAFVFFYGTKALQIAGFPLSLLSLMVPLPATFVARVVLILRSYSTEAASVILRLTGLPVFRNGFVLSLPGRDVEVAEQCSGIRSGFALFVTGLLIGYLFLRSPWRRLWLALAVLPITVFKNGLRIATLYWLTMTPRMESFTIWMHRNGGIPFSFLGVSFLALLTVAFRRFEESSIAAPENTARWRLVREASDTPPLV